MFPFDSELYCLESGKSRTLHQDLERFKRVYRIEDDSAKEHIKFLVEERDPSIIDNKYEGILEMYNYFCEWLESLNNAKAKSFKDALIQYSNKMVEYINRMIESNDEISVRTLNSDYKHKPNIPTKFWIKKIDSNTRKW